MYRNLPPKQPALPETAQIWDNSDREFVTAYRKDFRRIKAVELLKGVTFNTVLTHETVKPFEVPAYSDALICVDLDVTGTPTDIVISIYFSHDGADWFKYMAGPFGDLRYEDAAGDKKECLVIPVLAPYIKAGGVSTGTDADNTFKLTLRALLNG